MGNWRPWQDDPDRFGQIAGAIGQAERIIRATIGKGPAADPGHLPWMPFPLFAFIALLAEASPHIPRQPGVPPRFLEIGAGPGPCTLVARDGFGLDARGIEVSPGMAHEARMLGLDVETADVTGWSGFGKYDVIWFNRPLRDAEAELATEQRVWEEMAPGAVAICVNLEDRPPLSWLPCLDEWDDIRRGIWIKRAAQLSG
jgi:hypothetical protein